MIIMQILPPDCEMKVATEAIDVFTNIGKCNDIFCSIDNHFTAILLLSIAHLIFVHLLSSLLARLSNGYIYGLIQPSDLLDFIPVKLSKIGFIQKRKWLQKLLFGCEKCFAGQLALWTSVGLITWLVLAGHFSWLHLPLALLLVLNSINEANIQAKTAHLK